MANGTNYKLTKGKNFNYLKEMKKYEVDPAWVGDFVDQMPEQDINNYIERLGLTGKYDDPELGLLGKAGDIKKQVEAGRLKMYAGMPPSMYDAYYDLMSPSQRTTPASKGTAGYYTPRTAPTDTARALINPLQMGYENLDTAPHELGHEMIGHHIGQPKVPDLTLADKIDKGLHGYGLRGSYLTRKQGSKRYGFPADTANYRFKNWQESMYRDEHPYHPMTTDAEFKHSMVDPWLKNLSPEMTDQIAFQEYPMKYKDEATAPPTGGTPTGGDAGVEAVKNVRGWMQKNIPWMKRGEGWLPDNIYKKGNWFGDWNPDLGSIFGGDK